MPRTPEHFTSPPPLTPTTPYQACIWLTGMDIRAITEGGAWGRGGAHKVAEVPVGYLEETSQRYQDLV